MAQRLVTIEKGIDAWLDEYAPDAVAVERVFARSDSSTIMGTAQASGIALVAAARRGIPVALHTPSEVKAAVSGSGRAAKAQVGAMVARILRLDGPPKPADAADALALAITHVWRGGAQARIDAALAAQRGATGATGPPPEGAGHDRVRPRRRRRHQPHQRRARGRGSRARAHVYAGHAGDAAPRPDGDAADEHGRARGLADPVRLPRRRREVHPSSWCRPRPASGPKLAQAMLAVLSPDDLRTAVASDDVKTLTRVPGIGQKGAQRIILELKDRIGSPIGVRSPSAPANVAPWRDQVHQGLVGLGWSAKDAEKAVDAVAPEAGDVPDVAALLRSALRSLSKA